MEKDHEKTGKVQERTSSAQKIDSAQKTVSVSEPKFACAPRCRRVNGEYADKTV